ncbi:MAG: PEP-CTERM sorting domain-containing protein, partial [Blastopirellula sp. JB062]
LTFNAQPVQYYAGPITEGDYQFESNYPGVAVDNAGFWPNDGTPHLLTWNNIGSISGFTLTHTLGDAFDVESFDFAGGYVTGEDPTLSLTVSGFLSGNLIQTVTFIGGVDYAASGSSTLSTLNLVGFNGIDSLLVEAHGPYNRGSYDNFVIQPSAVPEPASLVLAAIGACAASVGAVRNRRRLAANA